jgi:Mitochondrial ATP synthase B chain precursor (ATP-synt_B)
VTRQKVALASEVKAVLDSWVRYEQQAKENEQAELARTVINSVLKSIQDEKTQKEILASAISEIEREHKRVSFIYLLCSFVLTNVGLELVKTKAI